MEMQVFQPLNNAKLLMLIADVAHFDFLWALKQAAERERK